MRTQWRFPAADTPTDTQPNEATTLRDALTQIAQHAAHHAYRHAGRAAQGDIESIGRIAERALANKETSAS